MDKIKVNYYNMQDTSGKYIDHFKRIDDGEAQLPEINKWYSAFNGLDGYVQYLIRNIIFIEENEKWRIYNLIVDSGFRIIPYKQTEQPKTKWDKEKSVILRLIHGQN